MPMIVILWLASVGRGWVASTLGLNGVRAGVMPVPPGLGRRQTGMTAGGEIMSVELADHTGPWTADNVEALPDAGDHARFGVYDGGGRGR